MKKVKLALATALCSLLAFGAAAESEELLEGFEGSSTQWTFVGSKWNDGDKSTAASVSADWKSEGEFSLKCEFGSAKAGAIAATFYTEKPAMTDISPFDAIEFDVHNPTRYTIQVAAAIVTGSGWDWHESRVTNVAAGKTRTVRVPLYEGNLKSASTKWNFSTDLNDPDDVKRMAFKFFIPQGVPASAVYVDNIRLIEE